MKKPFIKNKTTDSDGVDEAQVADKAKDTSEIRSSDMSDDKAKAGSAQETQEQEVEALLSDLQRTRADFENFRKQVDIQKEQAKKLTEYATVLKLLPLLDDIDRAIVVYPKELGSLEKSLAKILGELKLEKMNTESGVDFNPDYHDAISMDDAEGAREVIAETLRSGYLYDGEVLRPAMVRVSHAD